MGHNLCLSVAFIVVVKCTSSEALLIVIVICVVCNFYYDILTLLKESFLCFPSQ